MCQNCKNVASTKRALLLQIFHYNLVMVLLANQLAIVKFLLILWVHYKWSDILELVIVFHSARLLSKDSFQTFPLVPV
jgi:Co/Zn/Cd efflux system component